MELKIKLKSNKLAIDSKIVVKTYMSVRDSMGNFNVNTIEPMFYLSNSENTMDSI